MQVRSRIDAILAASGQDLESEFAATESIEALIPEFGWDAVRASLLDLLRDEAKSPQWRIVMHVFWGAVLDRRPLPADELIAWLDHQFDPRGDAEDNEVWSIASKLKGVGYLSEYKPLEDPGVRKHLEAIRGC